MAAVQIANPSGYIYAYTYVERGGTGLGIECPYYMGEVGRSIAGVGTIVKSYLLERATHRHRRPRARRPSGRAQTARTPRSI